MIEDFREFNKQVTIAANKAATSNWNDANPTKAELIAGEYAKGHIKFNGLDITIENPAGSYRSGDGWTVQLFNHYGFIDNVMGADGDELDVFVGEVQYTDTVTIVDRYLKGEFDECKCLVGFPDEHAAMSNYLQNFDADELEPGRSDVYTVIWSEFIDWIHNGDTTKPFAVWIADAN